MATRSTKLIIKNSIIPSHSLPSSGILQGEALVNLGDGILFFSGGTSGSPTWVPAGSAATASNYFEVGSNLYNLKIRNQITHYNGTNSLAGKFLSGTTSGFVLADISSIAGVDTYVTSFSYDDANVITLSQNNGQSTGVTINTMTGLTVSGTLSATTANIGTENVNTLNATGGTITTLGSTNINVNTLGATGATITTLDSTTINVNTLNATAGTITNAASNANDIVNLSKLTSYTQTNDVYVTGGTFGNASVNSNFVSMTLGYHGTPLGGPYTLSGKDTFTTGGTYDNSSKKITFLKNDGLAGYEVSLSSITTTDIYVTGGTITYTGRTGNIKLTRNDNQDVTLTNNLYDTYVTGLTYSNNTFTIKDNSGNTFSDTFSTVTGLTLSNLVDKQVVFAGPSGALTGKTGFEFNYDTNALTLPSNSSMTVGTGGLVVGSGGSFGNPGNGDLVVHGSLTIFGPSVSAFTSELYVEDKNIILNYNPTGSSSSTSLGAGWTIQDGSGGTDDVYLEIRGSGATVTQRGFVTNLHDIFIRNTNSDTSNPDGKRVLAEDDILDGGTY